jgi:hypothetical protein
VKLIFSLSGAYFHENFVQQNRKLSLEITRIKAPKRRRVSKVHVKQPEENAAESGSSAWSRFILFPSQDASIASGSNALTPHSDLSTDNNKLLPNGAVCQAACSNSCSHQPSKMAALSTSSDSPAMPNQQQQVPRDTSVADTYEWLISAGFPFSAFDPVAIETAQSSKAADDLIACADEIKSLFSLPSPPSSPKHAQPSSVQASQVLPKEEPFLTAETGTDTTIHFPRSLLDDFSPPMGIFRVCK